MSTKTHARIIRLEAGRGIAALIVVFSHLLKTFAPQAIEAVDGSVLFAFINGTGAVMFFFVLSGFVLTVRFFDNPSAGAMAAAAIKRLPRLAFLTTIVTLSSALLWKLGLYRLGSPWQLWPDFQPSFFAALQEGAWRTFMAGNAFYDRPLWTMVFEFRGSLLVFLIASFLIFVLKRQRHSLSGRARWSGGPTSRRALASSSIEPNASHSHHLLYWRFAHPCVVPCATDQEAHSFYR
jgi:peptidoglycan/LPS O-acetylase OafA/YrhL